MGSLVALEKKVRKIWFQVFVIVEGIFSGLINGLLLSGHPGGINGLDGETVMIWLFDFFLPFCCLKRFLPPGLNSPSGSAEVGLALRDYFFLVFFT